MLSMVQDKVVLIPHINLVIPEEFDMVEFKVFLFFVLPRVILNLKQVLVARILILQCFKTQGRVFSNLRRMILEMRVNCTLIF